MALKLRRQAGMFTNAILLHRASGRLPDSLREGADSFKRVLGCDWLRAKFGDLETSTDLAGEQIGDLSMARLLQQHRSEDCTTENGHDPRA